MKRLQNFFIYLFLIGGLLAIRPDLLTVVFPCLSPDSAEVAGVEILLPDSDSLADEMALDDCALPTRRRELSGPISIMPGAVDLMDQTVSPVPPERLAGPFALPCEWQFLQRTAADPRAPSRPA